MISAGLRSVIPAKAGIHGSKKRWSRIYLPWVPACAGTTLRLLQRRCGVSPADEIGGKA